MYNGNINVNVARNGAIINLGNSFVSNLAGAVSAAAPRLDAKQAVQAGAKALGLDLKQDLQVVKTAGGPSRAVVFNGADVSQRPIPVRLVFVPTGAGAVWPGTCDLPDQLGARVERKRRRGERRPADQG